MSIVTAVAVVVAGVLAGFVLWRMLKPRSTPSHQQQAGCTACGWKGTVSRYAGRCPSCNAPLGEQRARRPGR